MKVVDERTEVGPGDILTCQPDYGAPTQETTATKFKRLPTSTIAYPVAIRIE
jgi:hypothetical protein